MQRETGDKTFSIWLLGDSEPDNWKDRLKFPFDDRHPVIHNIWTSILDKIQDQLYRYNRSRLDASRLFIRNAVDNPALKPTPNATDWSGLLGLTANMEEYRRLISQHQPKLILSFGSFAYEFGRRCLQENPPTAYNHWNTKNLGVEFGKTIHSGNEPKLIPLLHRSISGGRFIESHKNFCGPVDSNYFGYVAKVLSDEIKDCEEIMIQ